VNERHSIRITKNGESEFSGRGATEAENRRGQKAVFGRGAQ
jgi:hypothetical protein